MKILFLAHRIPYPPNKGDKIRSFHELAYLARRHDVWLACLADQPDDLAHVATLEGMCRAVACEPIRRGRRTRCLASLLRGEPLSVGHFRSRRLRETVNAWIEREAFDAILAFSSTTAQYVPGAAADRPRMVMDLVDVDSEKFRAYAARKRLSPAGLVYAREARRLARYEAAIARRFDRVVVVTDAERDVFQRVTASDRPAAVVPNGVDTAYFQPGDERAWPNTMVFAGAMDYAPNVDAVTWFVHGVLPRVTDTVGGARLRIVGARPCRAVRRLAAHAQVEVVGTVPDIRPYVRTATVSVAPMRIARGVQNKVLEAMAMGVPVVTTAAGLEGLGTGVGLTIDEAQAGAGPEGAVPVVVADDESAFADAVCRVLKDRPLARGLSQGGRAFVLDGYQWERSMADLEALLAADPADPNPEERGSQA